MIKLKVAELQHANSVSLLTNVFNHCVIVDQYLAKDLSFAFKII